MEINKRLDSKRLSMEMDFLRRSARCSGLEKLRDCVIRETNQYSDELQSLYRSLNVIWVTISGKL